MCVTSLLFSRWTDLNDSFFYLISCGLIEIWSRFFEPSLVMRIFKSGDRPVIIGVSFLWNKNHNRLLPVKVGRNRTFPHLQNYPCNEVNFPTFYLLVKWKVTGSKLRCHHFDGSTGLSSSQRYREYQQLLYLLIILYTLHCYLYEEWK